MATRLPVYLVKDKLTDLNGLFFNRVFSDLDSRIDSLEQVRISWEQAVQSLRDFGLDRIDATIMPVIEAAQAALAAAQAQVEELQQMIADADIPALLAAQTAAVEVLIGTQQEQVDTAVSDLQTQLDDIAAIAYAGL